MALMANEFKKVFAPIVIILALFASVSIYFYKNYGGGERHAEGIDMKLGETVPDFRLEKIPDQSAVSFYDVKAKVTWIHFWATWCQSCVVEMPAIDRLWKKYRSSGLELVAISLDDDPFVDVPPMLKKLKVGFPSYWNPDQTISDIFDISLIPLSILVNSDHKILWIETGEGDWDSESMHEMMDTWLKK